MSSQPSINAMLKICQFNLKISTVFNSEPQSYAISGNADIKIGVNTMEAVKVL
jgi:hypothetical protein